MKGITVNVDSILVISILLANIFTVFSNDISSDIRRHHSDWLSPVDKYPSNYYESYQESPWKRAPSAGFYGMRGKKVPQGNFFGMRGKKGPSGFLGMRGKKMSGVPQLNSDLLTPIDLYQNGWTGRDLKEYMSPASAGRLSSSYSSSGPGLFSEDIADDFQEGRFKPVNLESQQSEPMEQHRIKRTSVGQTSM